MIPLADLDTPQTRARIKGLLSDGALIAYPTDTLYGLGGDFFNFGVHQRIDEFKERSDQPYSVALWDPGEITFLASSIPEWFHSHSRKVFPGPFTLVFPASAHMSPELLRGGSTIAVRVPGEPFPRKAMARIGIPLVSTSINRSGSPPLKDPARILKQFPDIDILIDAGPLPASRGSTIIDLNSMPPHVIRKGEGLRVLAELGLS